MAKITTVLRSPLDVTQPQVLLIDAEGDGCPIAVEDLKTEGLAEVAETLGKYPGLADCWYKPEDVQKWRDHFVGYTTEQL